MLSRETNCTKKSMMLILLLLTPTQRGDYIKNKKLLSATCGSIGGLTRVVAEIWHRCRAIHRKDPSWDCHDDVDELAPNKPHRRNSVGMPAIRALRMMGSIAPWEMQGVSALSLYSELMQLILKENKVKIPDFGN